MGMNRFTYGNILTAQGAVDAAPDASEVEAITSMSEAEAAAGSSNNSPVMVWVGLVLLLVLVRLLQEWRGKGGE